MTPSKKIKLVEHCNKNKALFILVFLFFSFSLFAQKSDELWSESVNSRKNNSKNIKGNLAPFIYKEYQLNLELLKSKLLKSPKRKGKLKKSSKIISFPNSNGTMERYEVFETSIMDESLQKKFPKIKSYIGKGIDTKGAVIRFSTSKLGLHAMTLKNSESTVFIDPITDKSDAYIVYSKKDLPLDDSFQCKFDEFNTSPAQTSSAVSAKLENATDGKLRTFKLAIAATAEYSQYHLTQQNIAAGAPEALKKEAVMSAIAVTMVRVNGIFERDMSLTMVLVANNDNVIFFDSATDGFTNDDSEKLINESQTIIDANIGINNYDIGHTFSTGGGGLATLNSPCTTSKAKGITGSSNPIGDSYYIDYVAHEMGHQFGAHHTFNGDAGNCAGVNRNDGTAVEPGSGSTIMAYPGLCAPQNVQSQSDAYFHLISIREMWFNITAGNSTCAAISTTGNNAPVIEALSNYTIPISTPFVLDATATDIDGDNLTYTWEQLDTEITAIPLVSTAIGGPSFRSMEPSNATMRFFPKQNTVVAGDLSNEWEVLPSVARTMRFGLNVRDNHSDGGQTVSDETTLTVDGSSGPFKVTSQASPIAWDAGTAQTITWDVASTNVAPINCEFVTILLSTDGGFTYPITLASNVANDGLYDIVVPNNTTNTARVKVQSVGNVFYAINSANISIQASEFIMNFETFSKRVCGANTAVYSITYNTFLSFNELTTFSAEGLPSGASVAFNPTTATSNNTSVEMTVSGVDLINSGEYTISVIGTSASTLKTTVVTLENFSSTIAAPNLIAPINNDVKILKPYSLTWNNDGNILNYDIEVAADNSFVTVIESAIVTENSYNPSLLNPDTTYYWRVKGGNDCGESVYSSVFSFTTENETCNSIASTDIPLNIPDNTTTGVNSVINVSTNKIITDLNVTVNISHSYISDLTLKLTSPTGIVVLLSSNNGGEGTDYSNTLFDDSASTPIQFGISPFLGAYVPQSSLSVFNFEKSLGDWTLNVSDSENIDTGILINWSLEICGVPPILGDNDNDGVLDGDDLCANTPLRALVDIQGCSSFSLPPDNFSVESISETCTGENNGQILITPNEIHDYTTTINGVLYSFTNQLIVDNLSSGFYDFCIIIAGKKYEQCFNIEIGGGVTISGKANVSSNKVTVEIEEGTAPFDVSINEEVVLQTRSPSFTLNVNHGDVLQVKTSKACEGVFSKEISLVETIIVYPNPTNAAITIVLPISEEEVNLELFNIQSKLILSGTYAVVNGKLQIDLSNYPSGLYFVRLQLKEPITLKILKY